jgi:hypothetical protein
MKNGRYGFRPLFTTLFLGLAIARFAPVHNALADDLPVYFQPRQAPEPSSVSVVISAPAVGESSDASGLGGSGRLSVGLPTDPIVQAQLYDVELTLVDGMDFSLLGGAVTVRAEPGAASIRMIESGSAGIVTDGQFDQLENIFQFEGEIFLSTQEGPYNLSSVPPIVADLRGIQLKNQGDNNLSASFGINLEFVAAVAVPLWGQLPLSILIDGRLEASTLLADFDANGRIDANDIDLLHAAIRSQSNDIRYDLTGDGVLDQLDSFAMVRDVMRTWYGDANLDFGFDSADLVTIFQVGEYEDAIVQNSGWMDGDWTGDGEADSGDLVLAWQESCYESCLGPRLAIEAVPEPSSLGLAVAVVAWVPLRLRLGRRTLGAGSGDVFSRPNTVFTRPEFF